MITANTPSLKASRRPVSDPSKLRGSSAFWDVIRPSLAQAGQGCAPRVTVVFAEVPSLE